MSSYFVAVILEILPGIFLLVSIDVFLPLCLMLVLFVLLLLPFIFLYLSFVDSYNTWSGFISLDDVEFLTDSERTFYLFILLVG